MGTERTGTSIGIMNMCGYLFSALGEPLLRFIIEKTGETKFLFAIIALICLFSSLIIYTVQGKKKF